MQKFNKSSNQFYKRRSILKMWAPPEIKFSLFFFVPVPKYVCFSFYSVFFMCHRFGPVCPQRLPNIQNETAALEKMPKGRLEYLRRLLPYLQNQSEDCLYLNIYVPIQGKKLDALCSLSPSHFIFCFILSFSFLLALLLLFILIYILYVCVCHREEIYGECAENTVHSISSVQTQRIE